jgi:hypothetical protein
MRSYFHKVYKTYCNKTNLKTPNAVFQQRQGFVLNLVVVIYYNLGKTSWRYLSKLKYRQLGRYLPLP